eukprot:TRINITY_DN10779_c0_g1_i2.p6 TRINITY_DN10779_c0_g1~~TRINITY_DN10779_c0_g1_i2.p6  ORF type:complete len:221 (-),score=56.47 TRINITY_DN10779_c0_g1_i2:286-873(-)
MHATGRPHPARRCTTHTTQPVGGGVCVTAHGTPPPSVLEKAVLLCLPALPTALPLTLLCVRGGPLATRLSIRARAAATAAADAGVWPPRGKSATYFSPFGKKRTYSRSAKMDDRSAASAAASAAAAAAAASAAAPSAPGSAAAANRRAARRAVVHLGRPAVRALFPKGGKVRGALPAGRPHPSVGGGGGGGAGTD